MFEQAINLIGKPLNPPDLQVTNSIKYVFMLALAALCVCISTAHATALDSITLTKKMVNAYKNDDGNTYVSGIKNQLKAKRLVMASEEKSSLLVLAVTGKRISVSKALINWGANANAQGVVNLCSDVRKSTLSKKDAWQCEPLTENKGLLESVPLTPLQAACAAGHADIMRMLLSNGAIAAQTEIELDALGACLVNKKFELAALLIDAGAIVDGKANDMAPLMDLAFASANERDQVAAKQLAQKMLDKGANPNHVAREGYSVLHSAAGAGNLAVVKVLVERGADLNLKTAKGMTPLASAENAKYVDKSKKEAVIEYLLSKGAKK
jgi:Ankyrin repeats (many copies)